MRRKVQIGPNQHVYVDDGLDVSNSLAFVDLSGKVWLEIVQGLKNPLDGINQVSREQFVTAFRQLQASTIPPPAKVDGEGIILCGGSGYWDMLVTAVHSVRDHSRLPIQIWHRLDEVIKPQQLANIPDLTFHVANELPYRRLASWETKTHALVHCGWERAIFLDADSYLVRDPGQLISLATKESPFIFWRDLLEQDNRVDWSAFGLEGDNGVVPVQGGHLVVNRRHFWRELILTYWLDQYSDYSYRYGFGDQDLWRVALSATKAKYKCLGEAMWQPPAYICSLDGSPIIVHYCKAKNSLKSFPHLPGWAKATSHMMPDTKQVTWVYGVTTVPQRRDTLLPETLKSLRTAGFNSPRLFIDGSYAGFEQFGLSCSYRIPQVRTAGNWTLALAELLIREPLCQRYAIFQDDLLAVKNLRQYLDSCKFPAKGYWNLYTFPQNQQLAKGKGWFLSNQKGLSALGLVFDREGAMRLLSDYQFVAKATNLNRGWRNTDGHIIEAMRRAGYQEWVHSPSLLIHVGDPSTMGNAPYPKATNFPGETFDAMTLKAIPDGAPFPMNQQLPVTGLGDSLQKALEVVGVTEERVSAWLGRPCNCRRRKEKLNNLGSWIHRILSGKIEKGREYLESLMTEEA